MRITCFNKAFSWIKPASILLVIGLAGCSARVLDSQNRVVGSPLPNCPASPNCVISEVGGAQSAEQRVAAFRLNGDVAAAWKQLRAELVSMPRTTVVFEQADYIHAEVVSPWRVYTDDLALRLDRPQQLVHLRSSSRLGYYDFGVNRERVEALRQQLLQADLIQPRP